MLGEIGVVCDGVEGWRVEFGERWVGVLAVETFLVAIDPKSVSRPILRDVKQNSRRDWADIVFQLKQPSYEMLRRCGSFVKSTVLVRSSRPAKYTSNG